MKEIVITANEAGQRLDRFLRKYLVNMPLSGIYKAIRKKDIKINGNKSSEKYVLNQGDVIQFYFGLDEVKKEKKLDFLSVDYDFKVAYEDENILVVEKKANLLVHPDEGKGITLTDQVLSFLYDKGMYNPSEEKTFSPAPCNRLDRNTEGLVIFAKNYDALKAVNEAIRDGGVEKHYTAMVSGRIADDTYRAYILKDMNTNRVTIHESSVKGAREIITKVSTIDSIGQFSVIDIDLITGRSHQIRAHLSWLGNPIAGDPKYGDKKTNAFFRERYNLENQFLIAYKLIFKSCPESIRYLEGKTITMALPSLFKKIQKDLFKI
jgi:23S rRNA pseudouridine955/2504/2580 synthase